MLSFVFLNSMMDNKHMMEVMQNEIDYIHQEEYQNTEDLAELCRSCANTSDHMIPIFEGEGLQHNLHDKINKYLPISVIENDSLSQQLCYHCAATILAYHEISQGCLIAQEKLLQIQKKIINRPEEERMIITEEPKEPKIENSQTESQLEGDAIIEESLNDPNEKEEKPTTSNEDRSELNNTQEPQQIVSLVFEEKQFNVIRRTFPLNVPEAQEKLKLAPAKKKKRKIRKNNTFQNDNDELDEKNDENAKLRLYKCSLCGKSFRQGKDYKTHIKTHSQERRYTCHVCGKQFSLTGSLYYHLRHVHEGIKNHSCDICGKSFAMKKAMQDHRRIHTGERPYACNSCGKSFKTRASLYIHSKTHSDKYSFECTYCKKEFRWKQQLSDHTTIHTGEKKHICDICGKSFGVKYGLTRHKRIHSTEKPFICDKCGCTFAQKRYLRSHELTKHKT